MENLKVTILIQCTNEQLSDFVANKREHTESFNEMMKSAVNSIVKAEGFVVGDAVIEPIDELMNFGDAIAALKQGKKVARQGWNGKGMFLVVNGGYSVEAKDTRPDSSLNAEFLEKQEKTHLEIGKHIDMWTAQKNLCVGWLASQTDIFSEDWVILN